MTQSKKFIDDIFVVLQEKFPTATIQYQYKTDTHFVKITPTEVYNSDDFIDFGIEFYSKFDDLESDELLCFITEGSLTKLDKPSVIRKPIESVLLEKKNKYTSSFKLPIRQLCPVYLNPNRSCMTT